MSQKAMPIKGLVYREKRRTLTGRDASVLALLAQVPDELEGAALIRARLLGRLKGKALEIGEAVIANEGGASSLNKAQETASEIKKWADNYRSLKANPAVTRQARIPAGAKKALVGSG